MRTTKKLQKEIDDWIMKHGACSIDIKDENIKLWNGGLWQDCNEKYAELWAGELHSTILYQNLEYFLNKKGFNTKRDIVTKLKQRTKLEENDNGNKNVKRNGRGLRAKENS